MTPISRASALQGLLVCHCHNGEHGVGCSLCNLGGSTGCLGVYLTRLTLMSLASLAQNAPHTKTHRLTSPTYRQSAEAVRSLLHNDEHPGRKLRLAPRDHSHHDQSRPLDRIVSALSHSTHRARRDSHIGQESHECASARSG
jgi:hypothetical protein